MTPLSKLRAWLHSTDNNFAIVLCKKIIRLCQGYSVAILVPSKMSDNQFLTWIQRYFCGIQIFAQKLFHHLQK